MNKGGRSYEGLVNDPKREGLRWENKQGGTGFKFFIKGTREKYLNKFKKKAVYISARRQEGTGE